MTRPACVLLLIHDHNAASTALSRALFIAVNMKILLFALFAGAIATQTPISISHTNLDEWLGAEADIALTGILNSIGDTGVWVQGASRGVVVASPSREEPDCTYATTSMGRERKLMV